LKNEMPIMSKIGKKKKDKVNASQRQEKREART
jgi:hypothetical protein